MNRLKLKDFKRFFRLQGTCMRTDSMKDIITAQLQEIERSEGGRILHAVESGSRAWGFPSQDSDYDVRFIYVHPLEHYLRLEETRDVIELPLTAQLDINGWDLRKALQLLYRTNPSLLDWMASPVIYRETPFAAAFRPLMLSYFSPLKALHHYLRMAERNERVYLTGEMVGVKKYFYVLRPVLAGLWILRRKTPPPMAFTELMEAELAPEMRPLVEKLIELKRYAPEQREIPREAALHAYLERCMADIRARAELVAPTRHAGWEPLNAFFREVLMQPWS